MCKVTGKNPGILHMSLGDVHLYKIHYDLALEQSERIPYSFPSIKINKEIKNITDLETLKFEDFILENYNSHCAIKTQMIA